MCADTRIQLYSSRRDQIHPVAATVHEAKWRATPNRYLEVTDVPGLNAQSPSELRWRLRVKSRPICRFEITVRCGTPFGLMDSRRYRSADPPSKVDAHGRSPERARRFRRYQ
jgi:hypothetical protein